MPSCPRRLKAFAPQFLVTQQGCDSHFQDPLAHMSLSLEGQAMSYHRLHRLAHTYTQAAGSPPVAAGTSG